jgi:hypothetical protein
MSSYQPDSTGICPHCKHAAKFVNASSTDWEGTGYGDISTMLLASGERETVNVYSSLCPNCKKPVVVMIVFRKGSGKILERRMVYPPNVARIAPEEVPSHIREDFLEAAAVLGISEKASAALSRRCLQNVLNEKVGKRDDLSTQIDEAIKQLPSRISENLDAVRNVGNYAAHPMKVKSTGVIVDVEPEEANWTLDVLEELFDYYYVMPKRAEERRKKLNEKLKSIGKPELKKP